MSTIEALDQSHPGLFLQITQALKGQAFNQRTEQTYLHWITRFVLFNGGKDPAALGTGDQQKFLTYLQERMRLSRARLNQAALALQFFYQDVLQQPATDNLAAAS